MNNMMRELQRDDWIETTVPIGSMPQGTRARVYDVYSTRIVCLYKGELWALRHNQYKISHPWQIGERVRVTDIIGREVTGTITKIRPDPEKKFTHLIEWSTGFGWYHPDDIISFSESMNTTTAGTTHYQCDATLSSSYPLNTSMMATDSVLYDTLSDDMKLLDKHGVFMAGSLNLYNPIVQKALFQLLKDTMITLAKEREAEKQKGDK